MSDSVLVIDSRNGQARSALAAVRALALGGFRPIVATASRCSLAGSSRHTSRVVDLPCELDDAFGDAIQSEIEAADHVGVLAASDSTITRLGLPGSDLVDKRYLRDRAVAVGLAVPATEIFETMAALRSARGRLKYPVVIKPAVPSAPARRADRSDDVDTLTYEGAVLVQPYLTEGLRALAGVVWAGRLVAAVHQRYLRTWPVDCGTASAAITTAVDRPLADRVTEMLKGYDGIFQMQLAGSTVLDLNPRVYGSLPLAVAAGVNLPAIWATLANGASVPTTRAVAGVRYRWIEGDLRHFVHAARRGQVPRLAEVLPRRGTAHSTESLADPRPLLRRMRHATGRCS